MNENLIIFVGVDVSRETEVRDLEAEVAPDQAVPRVDFMKKFWR
jgi:hypothetical protein